MYFEVDVDSHCGKSLHPTPSRRETLATCFITDSYTMPCPIMLNGKIVNIMLDFNITGLKRVF